MRIPASVLKGIRIGLSGTSLALAVAGCHKSPAEEPITQEATPATTVETASTTAPPEQRTEPARRNDGAPPASPFLVSPNRQASLATPPPDRSGEPLQPVPPPPAPPVVKVKVQQTQNQNRPPGWKNRVACACGRG